MIKNDYNDDDNDDDNDVGDYVDDDKVMKMKRSLVVVLVLVFPVMVFPAK